METKNFFLPCLILTLEKEFAIIKKIKSLVCMQGTTLGKKACREMSLFSFSCYNNN